MGNCKTGGCTVGSSGMHAGVGCGCDCHQNEGQTFFGYTPEQIRQMDLWFRSNNLSWQILDERYKQGFENGVKADREMIHEYLEKLMKDMKGK